MQNHERFHFLRFAINRELSELYISLFIKSLALAMIGIFIPIYFLKELGYSLQSVIYFYIIFSAVFGLFTPIAAKISSRIGFKHSIFISSPLLLIVFILLYLLKYYPIPLALIALVAGINDALFWIAFHTDFAKFSDRKHRAQEISVGYSLALIVELLGPLSGALILTFISFKFLFIFVSLLIIGSTIPLFLSKEIYEKAPFSLKYIFSKSHFRDMLSFIGYGIRLMGSGILWPIFIFVVLNNYLSLGIIWSIAGLLTAIFAIYVGRLADVFSKRTLIKFGSIFESFTWFFRVFAKTSLQIFAFTAISDLLYIMVDIPFSALGYDKASKSNKVEYLVFREMMVCVGRILILLVVLLISLNAGIFFTGVGLLLHMFF